jgi:hypothetical protein
VGVVFAGVQALVPQQLLDVIHESTS